MKNENCATQANGIDLLDVTPNVKFLTTLRNSGYSNYTAIADIIDNSIDTDVNSKNVNIRIKKSKDVYEFIKICDDGCGMDFEILKEAFKLGAESDKTREDLGSYGTGLKASALSIGRCFDVFTKSKDDEFYTATFDLDDIIKTGSFKIPIRIGTPEEYDTFKNDTGNVTGTVIVLKKLDRISNNNISIYRDTLIKKLGEIYKYYIEDFKIKFFVDGTLVKAIDPMWRNEVYSKCLTHNEKFEYKGNEFQFSVYHLEKMNEMTSKLVSRNNSNSGLYIYRNNRLVGSGLDLGIVTNKGKHGDGYLNGLRIELFMDGKCDELLGSTFNKMVHEKDKDGIEQGFRDSAREKIGIYSALVYKLEKTNSKGEVSDETKAQFDKIFEDAQKIPSIDVDKRGKNNPDPEPKTKSNPTGRKNKFSPRKRNEKYANWRLVKLGVTEVFVRTVKENGIFIIEINQDHPFWTLFLKDANFETKDVIAKLFLAMGISLEKASYFDDSEKAEFLNEYFLQVSENLRKYIK